MTTICPVKLQFINKGLECVVFEYGNDKVLKVYRSKSNAATAIENNKRACEHGIAPEVYSDKPFEINISNSLPNTNFKYAIICEKVMIVKPEDFLDCYMDDARYIKLKEHYVKIFPDIAYDLHRGNIGWKSGHLVMVDFGGFSISHLPC